jgi:hypothetical protein
MATESRPPGDKHERVCSTSELALLKLPRVEPPKPPRTSIRKGPQASPLASCDPAPSSCQQSLTLSFFFDGTGNNLDADVGTWEHSNVARLYRSHLLDSPPEGLYSFYIPGIGTLFMDREVQDPGGTALGRGFGAQGQARIEWALARLREKVKEAEARAQNPTNKICWIKVSAFGFSRGAALARAFARDLQKLCSPDAASPTGWRLTSGRHPIEISFLGLWDTVASAGLPPSANNATRNPYVKVIVAALKGPGGAALQATQAPELKRLAFGEAGADPAPGPADGHAEWADGMAIGGLVKQCAHMVAGHELRNSFPADSVLYQAAPTRFELPANTSEWVYPGVHSDVGGGYRPGEGGCRPEKGAQLSIVALRAMHELARKAGVKLASLDALTGVERDDFALDGPIAEQYAKTLDLWQHYQQQRSRYVVPGIMAGLGGEMVQHMRVYYAWRFHAIRQRGVANQPSEQKQQVTESEKGFAQHRKKLDAEYDDAVKSQLEAESRVRRANQELGMAHRAQARFGTPIDPTLVRKLDLARQDLQQKQTRTDRIRARITTAADDSKLNDAVAKYDRMLLRDARQIVAWMREDELDAEILELRRQRSRLEVQRNGEHRRLETSGKGIDPLTRQPTADGERMWQEISSRYEPRIADLKSRIEALEKRKNMKQGPYADRFLARLRPHYRALIDAYLDEFERNTGLRDEKVIAFFSDYVHDSLAGFDTDQTWPSDPRIIYVGGDRKLRFAQSEPPVALQASAGLPA